MAWGPEHENAFGTLTQILTSVLVLCCPDEWIGSNDEKVSLTDAERNFFGGLGNSEYRLQDQTRYIAYRQNPRMVSEILSLPGTSVPLAH